MKLKVKFRAEQEPSSTHVGWPHENTHKDHFLSEEQRAEPESDTPLKKLRKLGVFVSKAL